ncbi:hypothetical protein LshimejAT787_2100230 [Lyophyllum shimeji]|uniref:Uncharacterized protein n=1 Tax=Lyophyllum shimeji TaxID=47721 RepID=A0A9P3UU55_LYOSH|nr:hypothetical protein LshimejAT787_2100230 [Lyophyllum shimeji]
MKATFPLAVLSSFPFLTCRAATITLFAVQTKSISLPPASETFKPLGVGPDGMTTYLDHVVASVFWEQQLNGGGTTFTASDGSVITSAAPVRTYTVDPPVTYEGTLVADATHLMYHHDPSPTDTRDPEGKSLSCSIDGRGGGACVEEYWQTSGPTETTTYTGSAVPIYTLVTEDGKPQQGGGGNSNDAAQRTVGWGVVMVGVLVAALQVL